MVFGVILPAQNEPTQRIRGTHKRDDFQRNLDHPAKALVEANVLGLFSSPLALV
jgi:hypothetical protein